eukprot:193127-Alexandrium_andersonii.AAC.1
MGLDHRDIPLGLNELRAHAVDGRRRQGVPDLAEEVRLLVPLVCWGVVAPATLLAALALAIATAPVAVQDVDELAQGAPAHG